MRSFNKPAKILVVHCSATKPSQNIGVKQIRKWHKDRGWSDIGYHYVITRKGKIETGRPEGKSPAAQRGANTGTIAVCMVGGIDAEGNPDADYTDGQWQALVDFYYDICSRFTIVSICGHRDFSGVNKACPSFSVTEFVYRIGTGMKPSEAGKRVRKKG